MAACDDDVVCQGLGSGSLRVDALGTKDLRTSEVGECQDISLAAAVVASPAIAKPSSIPALGPTSAVVDNRSSNRFTSS